MQDDTYSPQSFHTNVGAHYSETDSVVPSSGSKHSSSATRLPHSAKRGMRSLFTVLIILILVGGLAAGLYLSKTNQESRSKAAAISCSLDSGRECNTKTVQSLCGLRMECSDTGVMGSDGKPVCACIRSGLSTTPTPQHAYGTVTPRTSGFLQPTRPFGRTTPTPRTSGFLQPTRPLGRTTPTPRTSGFLQPTRPFGRTTPTPRTSGYVRPTRPWGRSTPTPDPFTPTSTPDPDATPRPTPYPGSANLYMVLTDVNAALPDTPGLWLEVDFVQNDAIVDSLEVEGYAFDNSIIDAYVDALIPGTYDVYIKAWAHLRVRELDVTLVEGDNDFTFSNRHYAGDVTGEDSNAPDNRIDISDVGKVNAYMGQDVETDNPADINKDGTVNSVDMNYILTNYGRMGKEFGDDI